MKPVQWGIVGPGTIAKKFATAIGDVNNAELIAVGSHSTKRCAEFADQFEIANNYRFNDYQSLMRCEQVDAVYVANLNPAHVQTTLDALRSGKHVLCEKPAGMTEAEVQTMIEVAQQEQRYFSEAFMYLCHPQMARVEEIINSGELGRIKHIEASFGFSTKPDPQSRLFSHALGGGGILDVGCYPVSFARRVVGMVCHTPYSEPRNVVGVGTLFDTKVDTYAQALLKFDNDITASCSCSMTRALENTATVYGENGSLCLQTPWLPGNGNKPADATIRFIVDGKEHDELIASPAHHYSYEIASASTSIQAKRMESEHPALQHTASLGNARVLDQWRQQVGYKVLQDKPATNRKLNKILPSNSAPMTYLDIEGVGQPMSRLILGCDNKTTLAEGSVVWDARSLVNG